MRILLLFIVSFSVFALECPGGNPPNTTPGVLAYQFSNFTTSDPAQICAKVKESSPDFGSFDHFTEPNKVYCNSIQFPGYLYLVTVVVTQTCPSGYTLVNSVCTLSNPSGVGCDNNCNVGESVGLGSASAALVCLGGCQIKPRGMTASEIDASGNSIGVKLSEWEKTGSSCVQGGTVPVANDIDPSKPNCISNGARQLCVSTAKPGCGTINGKEWCPDQVGCGTVNGQRVCVPDDGGCTPSGGQDFACTKGANPPAQPPSEPPPVVDFKGTVPVQNGPAPTGGTPANGAMPNTPGSDTGGTASFTVGHYTGGSGNGTEGPGAGGGGGGGGGGGSGTGSGPGFSTDGLARESTLQAILNALSGSLSGSAWQGGALTPPGDVNLDPKIEGLKADIQAKISSIRDELSSLITFGGSGNATALQCPANSGFSFMGSNISLCTQSVLSATSTIGNVLIFLALVVSFFILLS